MRSGVCTHARLWLVSIAVLALASGCGKPAEPPPPPDPGTPVATASVSSPGASAGSAAPAVPPAGAAVKPPPVASPEPAPPEPGAPDPLAYRDRGLFPTASTCLYQLLKAEGDSTASLTQIRRTLRGDLQGISLGHLRSYLEQSGIAATVRRQPSADLLASGRPAIVLVRTKHTEQDPLSGQFVLCTGPAAEGVRIVDPLAGIRVLPVETFAGRYLGVSLRLDAPRNLPAREAPDLWCEEMVWSFEEVPSGAEIRHSFEITNRGDRPLKIERVETTCGCAAAMVGGKGELAADLIAGAKPEKETDPKKLVAQKDSGGVIEPGKSAWVSAYVNTLYKQGFMSFQLRLITNDPEEHESLLSLQGTVVRVFEWDPVTLWFPDVNATTGAFGYLWVRHHRSRAFRVTDIRSTSKHVAAWVEENAPREPPAGTQAAANPAMPPRSYPAEQGWVGLKVMVLPDAPIGTLSATLSLKAEDTPIEASVAALVKGNLVVEPAYFSFGHLHKGEAQSVSVTLRSALGEVLEVKSVTASKDFMRAAVQEGGAGTYRITLSLTEGWSDPDLQGVVTICTNDPLEPEKKVLVYGFIRR